LGRPVAEIRRTRGNLRPMRGSITNIAALLYMN